MRPISKVLDWLEQIVDAALGVDDPERWGDEEAARYPRADDTG